MGACNEPARPVARSAQRGALAQAHPHRQVRPTGACVGCSGKKVYERGFWQSDEEWQAKSKVLEGGEPPDGTIEDDNGENGLLNASRSSAGSIKSFKWADGTLKF